MAGKANNFYIKTENIPNAKEFFPGAATPIAYAFTVGDTDYFEIENFSSTPSDRAFSALTFMAELNQCVSREYLTYFCEAMIELMNDPKGIKMFEIASLVKQLKERTEHLVEIDIAYKLCSVVYFDASENPAHNDLYKSNQKAKLFREVKMDAFFLSAPIKKLVPFIDTSASDLRDYLTMTTQINTNHIKDISMTLSETMRNSALFKEFYSRNTTLNL